VRLRASRHRSSWLALWGRFSGRLSPSDRSRVSGRRLCQLPLSQDDAGPNYWAKKLPNSRPKGAGAEACESGSWQSRRPETRDRSKAKAGLKIDPKALAKKNGAATPEGAPAGTPTKDDPDAPLLDMSDAAVRKMVTRAKQRGYVTYDELNRVLPSDKVSSEQIEDTMAMLNEMGINVIESEEQEETEGEQVPAVAAGRQVAEVPEKAERPMTAPMIRCAMYLREMGSVELLSREGEIAIAKRIEAGRELMIGALCEGPLTFEALTVWRDELMEGKALLRDIIDLEAMYGGMPGAEGRAGPARCSRRDARHARWSTGARPETARAGWRSAESVHSTPPPPPPPPPPQSSPQQ